MKKRIFGECRITPTRKPLIYSAVVFGLSGVLFILSRLSESFAEWYTMNIYRAIVTVFARISGIVPFSLAEFVYIAAILAAITLIVLLIIKLKRGKGERKRILATSGAYALCVTVSALLVYMGNCGVQAQRPVFLHGYDVSFERTAAQEREVFAALLDEFEAVFPNLQEQIQTDENGLFILSGDLSETAPAAMRKLAETFPRLNGYYPQAKPVMLSGLMSDANLLGFFSPFTLEANYNNIAHDSEKAVSALHELVHLGGIMREDEANFIAFMAARNSGDYDLMYSAYVDLFYYLHFINKSTSHNKLSERFPDQLWRDFDAINNFWWNRFYTLDDDGEVVEKPTAKAVSDASSAVNDAYIQSTGQEGVVSYGKWIDLVFAYETL
ncbi:MAG: DUF3810 domain-containing protein [Oscillospiraceae bacterium]|nr:DUF3810 domain-containing protein [Oscillospiraceae bacterium]